MSRKLLNLLVKRKKKPMLKLTLKRWKKKWNFWRVLDLKALRNLRLLKLKNQQWLPRNYPKIKRINLRKKGKNMRLNLKLKKKLLRPSWKLKKKLNSSKNVKNKKQKRNVSVNTKKGKVVWLKKCSKIWQLLKRLVKKTKNLNRFRTLKKWSLSKTSRLRKKLFSKRKLRRSVKLMQVLKWVSITILSETRLKSNASKRKELIN